MRLRAATIQWYPAALFSSQDSLGAAKNPPTGFVTSERETVGYGGPEQFTLLWLPLREWRNWQTRKT
jgi:hypothetical protein